jgi:signal transduction histidine kinase
MISEMSPVRHARAEPTLNFQAAADESHRQVRKLYVVRSAQLAMGVLVGVAVVATLATQAGQLSAARLLSLAVAGCAYVAWTLYGTRDAARFALWHHRLGPTPAWPLPSGLRSVVHLGVQFGLAELLAWLAASAGAPGLLWLVLLPPVGFAVMFLRPPAVVVVSALSLAVHTFNVVYWHGWEPVPVSVPGFSVAVLFTLVFTQIGVSAEKARGEVERLAGELREANEKLREHAAQAEELAATRERNRLAREIHDGLGHCLTVVHVQLEAARSTLGRDPDRSAAALDKAQSMNHLALQEVRRSVSALRSSPLQGRPLGDALRELVAENRAAGLDAELAVSGEARVLSPQASSALYRAAQEGLTNARKHARPESARVTLDYRAGDRVRLVVADDGPGAGNATEGFGLLGLRERAQLLGGTVAVRTAPGEGFTLEVEVPG